MLGVTNYGAFIVAFLLLLALPGPGNLAIIHSTGKGGVAAGLSSTFGIMLGDQLLMWCAVAGVAALLITHPTAFLVVQTIGAIYLMGLGLAMLFTRSGGLPMITIKNHHYWRQSLIITVLNPKAIMFYMAFLPLFIDPAHHLGFITFGFLAANIAFWVFTYGLILTLVTFHTANHLRRYPWITLILEKLAGTCLIIFGLRLLLAKV